MNSYDFSVVQLFPKKAGNICQKNLWVKVCLRLRVGPCAVKTHPITLHEVYKKKIFARSQDVGQDKLKISLEIAVVRVQVIILKGLISRNFLMC